MAKAIMRIAPIAHLQQGRAGSVPLSSGYYRRGCVVDKAERIEERCLPLQSSPADFLKLHLERIVRVEGKVLIPNEFVKRLETTAKMASMSP